MPSEDSVYLHLDRAYLQIQDWQGNALEPTDYGWEIKNGLLEPIPMQQDPAPVCLMEVTLCKCKATKSISGRCSCYRSSVTCSIVSGCQNCENQDVEEEESVGEAREEDVNDMTAMKVTMMSDCCEKVFTFSGA